MTINFHYAIDTLHRPSNTQTLPSLTAIRLFAAAYEERSFSRAAARERMGA